MSVTYCADDWLQLTVKAENDFTQGKCFFFPYSVLIPFRFSWDAHICPYGVSAVADAVHGGRREYKQLLQWVMASFGWKRKIGERVSKATSQNFEKESADEAAGGDREDAHWLHSIKRKKGLLLEDNLSKSKRMKEEGALLALNGRHLEAIKKWDEGIHLTPEDAAMYEMKAQSLLYLQEIFPAVQAAETAVSRDPKFVEAWQTLGRAQLGLGEISMAIRSFQIGIHICPSNMELWEEDLNWARKLLQQKKEAEATEATETNRKDFSIEQTSIPDYDFESDEVVAACDALSRIHKVAAAGSKSIVVSSSGKVTNEEPSEDNASTSADPIVFSKAR
ncbi:tetratricopeptide repeat protein 33 [Anomaloglossus baeobatrachus]|uniref:tetratricopeptide repeat protein 33 n=1 Tax=Anomaloglossus baeobatrachus TaxID=238106 RepID=UPI003F4FE89A